MQENKQGRWIALDGIRAVAILMIIAYHILPHRFSAGFLGVDAFLFLSGYLTLIGLKRQEKKGTGLGFFKRLKKRARKVWRPMTILFIGVLAYLFLFIPSFLFNIRANVVSAFLFVDNWFQIHEGFSYFAQFLTPNVFTHLWYLALYMQFSLLFPLIFHFLGHVVKEKAHHRYIYLALAIVSLLLMGFLYQPGVDPTRIYYGTDTRAFSYLFGAFLAEIWPYDQKQEGCVFLDRKFFPWISGVCLLGMLYLSITFTDTSVVTYRFGMWLFDLLLLGLVLTLTSPKNQVERLLSLQPFRYIGERSLYLYLWYYPILVIYEKQLGGLKWPGLVHVLCQWFLIFAFAELAYRIDQAPTIVLFTKRFWKKVYALIKKSIRQRRFFGAETVAVCLILFLPVLALSGLLSAQSGQDPRVAAWEQQLQEQKAVLAKKHEANLKKEAAAKKKAKAEKEKEKEQDATADEATKAQEDKPSRKAKDKQEDSTPINHVKGLSRHEQLVTSQLQATFYGDSVLLATQEPLATIFPKATINGKVGRQLYQSIEEVDWLRKNGQLGDAVIFMLGTNGGFSDRQMQELISATGKRPVFLVNVNEDRSWENEVNQALKRAAKANKQVHLIDWKKLSKDHPEYFRDDAVHPTTEGSMKLAVEIAKQVTRVLDQQDKHSSFKASRQKAKAHKRKDSSAENAKSQETDEKEAQKE